MRALRSASGAAPSIATAHSSSSFSGRRVSAVGGGGAGTSRAGFSGGAGLSSISRSNGLLNGFFFGTEASLSVAPETEALHLAPQRGGGDVQVPRHLLEAAAGSGEGSLDGFAF